jgi:hypothetical protein
MDVLIHDCLRLIMNQLSPEDWRSFILTEKRLYGLTTKKDREAYTHTLKGIYYSAKIGDIDAVKWCLRMKSINCSDVAMLAAAYDHSHLVEWLIKNRLEVKSLMGWMAVICVHFNCKKTFPIVAMKCDLQRKYIYYRNINDERCNITPGFGILIIENDAKGISSMTRSEIIRCSINLKDACEKIVEYQKLI